MSNPSLLCVPYRFKTSTLYSQIPDSGLGDFTVTRSASNAATRVNAQGFIETVADNVPRLDYPLGGITAGCPALLVEPAATNGIRNNSMVGAVAGSPGTLPTNWNNSGSGLTRQSVATGTLNGIPYVDIRISGTASNTFHDVFWESSNIIAALVGQDWVASCYLQIVAQPNPPVSYTLAMREFNSGGGFLGVFQGAALSISTTSFNRFSFTRALNQATVAFVNPSLFFHLVNGQPYDFTIRIGYPQMERGSVATSVIPTTTGSVTRGAETVSKTGVSSLIGQTEGTIYAEVDIRNMAKETYLIRIDDGATANVINLRTLTSNLIRTAITAPTTSGTINISSAAFTAGIVKIAFAYKSGEIALSVNGATALTANGTFVFSASLNRITLGSNVSGGELNDRIRAAALYPTRLTNAQLQSLTQ